MSTLQVSKQKYDIISWITSLENREIIRNLHKLAIANEEIVHLSDAQKSMLRMSEDDIKHGRLISEEKLMEQDEIRFD